MRKTVYAALAAVLALSLGCAPKEQTLKIGFNIPLTGDSPMIGEGPRNTGEMIRERINAAGGWDVKGTKYKLEFIYVDNELKAESAVQAALRLIEQDQVLVMIGPQGSGRAIPAGQIADENRTPMIAPWSTNPATTENRPYVFRACFLDPFQAPVGAKFAQEQFGANRVAILYNLEDDYSKTLAELFRDSWIASKGAGSVTAFESHGQKDTNFEVQLGRIIRSGADLLYLPVYYDLVAKIVPQAQQLGWTKPIMGSDSWGSADLISLSNNAVEGYYFTTHYAAAGATGATKAYIDDYNARYGYVPDDVAALTYDAIYIALNAIQQAGLSGNLQEDRDNIRAAIAGLREYDGITGRMTFNDSGDPEKDAVVVHIVNGEFTFVTAMH
ncbi:MAG: ABC transporter substrate-binding protein [Spirochaetaceae bacterium]|jgi:branched-chain amino acid transport system substrate-binding protein|nr:ABC transporter substrate-binding protein [Spirochaetaceae bacterium]